MLCSFLFCFSFFVSRGGGDTNDQTDLGNDSDSCQICGSRDPLSGANFLSFSKQNIVFADKYNEK